MNDRVLVLLLVLFAVGCALGAFAASQVRR